MSAALRVLAPGLLTTIQDLGRPGYQSLGIPVGGALDPVSLRAANTLVGNPPGEGALEVAYVGPTLVVEAQSVRLACVGGEAQIQVRRHLSGVGARRIETMRSTTVERGEVISIGPLTSSAVLYLAIEGGFDIEPVLGSLSTYLRGSFGGLNGRALSAGDRLPLSRSRASTRGEWRLEGLDIGRPERFRAVVGPQSDHFSARELAAFFAGEYTVGPGSNRMAMRLAGRPVAHRSGYNIISDAIAPGSIQVPGNGQPIVLLADRQTTGGYPKIATVISADLAALGRVPMGARIGFEEVTLEEAHALRRRHMEDIEAIPQRIVPVLAADGELAPHLFNDNLISGVIDARRPM